MKLDLPGVLGRLSYHAVMLDPPAWVTRILGNRYRPDYQIFLVVSHRKIFCCGMNSIVYADNNNAAGVFMGFLVDAG